MNLEDTCRVVNRVLIKVDGGCPVCVRRSFEDFCFAFPGQTVKGLIGLIENPIDREVHSHDPYEYNFAEHPTQIKKK